MKLLLLGEYSNVHWTLAEGLRALGHEVTVLSNGDFWKNYPRDIDLVRKDGKIGGIAYYLKALSLLPKLRGYDIVQLINPMFLELKAERMFFFYDYLRKHNKKIVLGAFGMDYYWCHVNAHQMPLRYSDFNIGSERRTDTVAMRDYNDWVGTAKGKLNQYIARDCDAIVSGLYEYDVTYRAAGFGSKTIFIPFPIQSPIPTLPPVGGGVKYDSQDEGPTVNTNLNLSLTRGGVKYDSHDEGSMVNTNLNLSLTRGGVKYDSQDEGPTVNTNVNLPPTGGKVGYDSQDEPSSVETIDNLSPTGGGVGGGLWESAGGLGLFIGISRSRSVYKGTDKMLRAAQRIAEKYPDRVKLTVAEGVPFAEYQKMLDAADVILDQLYAYTPGMNALEAMSRGTILVGGGEEEQYGIINETELRPIINVQPTEESVYEELERLVLHGDIQQLKRDSIEYVRRHHDYIKVAKQYEKLYQSL